jgi:hypothetical protein
MLAAGAKAWGEERSGRRSASAQSQRWQVTRRGEPNGDVPGYSSREQRRKVGLGNEETQGSFLRDDRLSIIDERSASVLWFLGLLELLMKEWQGMTMKKWRC